MGKSKKKIVRPPQYVAKVNRKKKPMDRRLKIGLIAGASVLVVAVVLFFALYDDGSLPMKNGKVVTEGDNWIVSNLSSNGQRYYKLGEVTTPEGFTLEPDTHYKSDTNETDFFFQNDDENAQLSMVYYAGVNQKLSELVPSAQSFLAQFYGEENVSDIKSATISMHPVQYFTTLNTESQEEAEARAAAEAVEDENENAREDEAEATPEELSGEGATEIAPVEPPEATPAPESATPEAAPVVPKTTQTLNCYVATVRGVSILIQSTLDVTDEMPPLNDEEILALAEKVVGYLVLEPYQNGK